MLSFNDYIIYDFLKPEEEVRLPNAGTCCISLPDGRKRIALSLFNPPSEEEIAELLNHEYLHASLRLMGEGEASDCMDVLWYEYSLNGSIFYRKILEELSYSGIGYPDRASFREVIVIWLKRIHTRVRMKF